MNRILTIMLKEIRDNFRDRRSIIFAFIYGPFFMPALMFGPILFSVNKYSQDYEKPVKIHVYGQEVAPNLAAYLRTKNMDIETVEDDFTGRISAGDLKFVLEIPPTFAEKFVDGYPARVILHYDKENKGSEQIFWRVRGELQMYSRHIASQRMRVRGFDQALLKPIDIFENDVSNDEYSAGMIANIIMFIIMISTTMGGFYLAVDATAGERERSSLEPLLSLPLTRLQIVMGKYLAILTFVFAAFVLPMISVAIWTTFIPEKTFGNADAPGFLTYAKLVVMNLPICFLVTGFLMAIAAFSKSSKEAQTQMGMAMFVPMAPFFIIQFSNIKLTSLTGMMPIMGQYLYADKIIVDPDFSLVEIIPCALTTLGLGAVFLAIAVNLYHKESIL